jgi:Cd2+/Zn2+-exporting ATPase
MAAVSRTYLVSGVCCATEEALLRKRLNTDIGEGGYTFNLMTGELSLLAPVDEPALLRSLRGAGFTGRRLTFLTEHRSWFERHGVALWTAGAALFAAGGLVIQHSGGPDVLSRALLLAAILLGGWNIFRKAFIALRNLTLDMNVLMSLAVAGALAIDRWSEGAAVIVLFSVALILESYSISRTRRAVQALMDLAPQEARVVRNGIEITVPAAEVAVAETVRIRPGERIPVDGVVLEGASTVHQGAVTGESHPVEKSLGTSVFAGTLNGQGTLLVQVEKNYEDTTIAQIIHLIEHAEQQRAPVQSFVDRFAAVYTPAVLGIAFLVAVVPPLTLGLPFVEWLYRALVLLVIACPCALVISTPVTIVSALTNAARQGVLIKGGKHLEVLSSAHTIAFDKTGTLTEGRPRLTDVVPLNAMSERDLLRLMAAIEHHSEHHLAGAVLEEALRRDIRFDDLTISGFEALPGRGVRATINGTAFFFGNHQLCEEEGFCSPVVEEALAAFLREGKTAVVLGRNGAALGIVAMRDTIRANARDALAGLREVGVSRMVLLSGDHPSVVERIARDVGITEWYADLLPQEKVRVVQDLRARHVTVVAVGDGINDAPALATSSVGIAMGGVGSDAALESADVVLMGDDLSRLPHLVAMSRKAMAIIRQNVLLALSLKGMFMILSLAGVASLWMAILADDGAALLVIINGLRMLRFRL